MPTEEFDLEFPPGSQKRQEEEARLERERSQAEENLDATVNLVAQENKVPEEVWRRGSTGQTEEV